MKLLLVILVISFCVDQITPQNFDTKDDHKKLSKRFIWNSINPIWPENLRHCIKYTLDTQFADVFGFLPLLTEFENKMETFYNSSLHRMEEINKVEVTKSFAYFLKSVTEIVSIMIYILNIPTEVEQIASNLTPRIVNQYLDCVIDGPPEYLRGSSG